jgi:hypothetical protein
MRTAQRGPAAKNQAKRRGLGCSYRCKRFHDVPVLFDEGGTWQSKMFLDCEQLLQARLIVRAPAPTFRTGAVLKSAP